MDSVTQCSKILWAIKTHNGIENWRLARIALNYRGRISDLRKEGWNIYCERQIDSNGRYTGTWKYYLNDTSITRVPDNTVWELKNG